MSVKYVNDVEVFIIMVSQAKYQNQASWKISTMSWSLFCIKFLKLILYRRWENASGETCILLAVFRRNGSKVIFLTIINIPPWECVLLVSLAVVSFSSSVKRCTCTESCCWSLTKRLKGKSERGCWFLTIDTGIPGLGLHVPEACCW